MATKEWFATNNNKMATKWLATKREPQRKKQKEQDKIINDKIIGRDLIESLCSRLSGQCLVALNKVKTEKWYLASCQGSRRAKHRYDNIAVIQEGSVTALEMGFVLGLTKILPG